jgi:ABC-2 type transport system permease protein
MDAIASGISLRSVTRGARLYGRLQLLHVRAFLEYEADFWVGILAMFLRHGSGLAFIWVLFESVNQVGGWSKWEMIFLYALLIIPRGTVELIANGQYRLGDLVHGGEFDRLLLRPFSPVLQVLSYTSAIHGLGSMLLGCVMLVTASANLHMAWDLPRLLLLIATLAGSVVLMVSVSLATNCISFWVPGASGAFPNFVNNLMELAKFPLTIYGMLVQSFLTLLLPFAFISYYPTVALLGRSADAGAVFPPWLSYVSPLAGPLVALLVSRIWRTGMARYQGAGH